MRSLGERFEFRPGKHRSRSTRNGIIVVTLFTLSMVYMLTGGSIVPLPEGGKLVKAEFRSAVNLALPTTTVRVGGVDVGKIEKVERNGLGKGVVVTMRLEDGHDYELKRDAKAHIYWRTLLGFQFYIELDPGSAEQGLDGQTIAIENTTTQVELDEVLTAADQPTRQGLRDMFGELERGFAEPEEAGRVLDRLAPSMRQIGPGLAAVRGERASDLGDLVEDADSLTTELGRSETELAGLIGSADRSLAVTAARRAALGQTLRVAPAALDETTATMTRLRTTLDELDPVVQELRPGARRLDETSEELRPAMRLLDPVLTEARPLLRELRPALTRLNSAADSGNPLLAGLDPTLKRTRNTLLPWLDTVDAGNKIKNFQAIGPVFATVASSAQQFDVHGHTQRFQAAAGSGRSLSFLPCAVNFPENAGLDCADLEKAVGALIGAPAPGSPASRAAGGSSAPKVDLPPVPTSLGTLTGERP